MKTSQPSHNAYLAVFFLLTCAATDFILRSALQKPLKALAVVDEAVLEEPLPIANLLTELKKKNVYGIALNEWTMQDLLERGMMERKGNTYSGSFELVREIYKRLLWSLPEEALKLSETQDKIEFSTALKPYQMPLGFFPEQIEPIQQAGLHPVLRVLNHPFAGERGLSLFSSHLSSLRPSPYLIFAQDEVLGFSGGLRKVSELMKKHGFILCRIEFARQRGEKKLHALLGDAEWVHSIHPEEFERLSFQEIVDRYQRALKERSVRLFYLRPFSPGRYDHGSLELFRILDQLNEKKLLASSLPSYSFRKVPRFLYALLAAFVGASTSLLILAFLPRSSARHLTAIAFPAVMIAAGYVRFWLPSLIAALFLPSLVLFYAYRQSGKENPYVLFGKVFLLTLLSALSIQALLATKAFVTRLDTFHGVKLAFLVPLSFSFILLLHHYNLGRLAVLKKLTQSPVSVGAVIFSLFLLAALYVLLVRTGNQGKEMVLPMELKVRLLLEHLFTVRPRFKEAFIGYPALTLFFLLTAKKKKQAIFLLPVASLGLATTINTFLHLHTPLPVSLTRTLLGSAIGLALGSILSLVYCRIEPVMARLWQRYF